MQDLQLIGVHEDGEHLLLSGPDDTRFRMPVDESLRAAIRRDRPHLGRLEVDGGLRPRDVQALIRAGATADEAASRAGWTVEKVHRYEGPILAEREHIAGLAQKARLRSRSATHSSAAHNGAAHNGGDVPTLSVRVAERLRGRGVEETDAGWDSWRAEGGPWTVVLTFAAGGRQRQASWSFNLADRTVAPIDDEARWLSEEVEDAKGPIPASRLSAPSMRASTVYDVEAEGGLRSAARIERDDDPLDLMTAMRKRSTARGRGKPGGHRGSSKTAGQVPVVDAQALQADEAILAQVQPDQAQPDQAQPNQVRPERVRPDRVQPDRVQPDRVQPDRVQPDQVRPDQVLPETAAALIRPADGDFGQQGDEPEALVAEVITLDDTSAPESNQVLESVETPSYKSGSSVPAARPATRPLPREAARKNVRPSVPAWDEIMFGSRPGSDRSSS